MTTDIKKNYNLHILSLIIFSTYYLFSFIVFETVVVNPHDNLEIEAVLDHVISRIFRGDFDSYKVFLSGEYKWHYLDRIFYPINLLLTLLSDKQFYFFKEILEKIISYFSFYLLGKFLFKNKTYSIFGALFYATIINDINSPAPTIFLPFMPYLLYLLISKDQFKLKHLAVIFFIGLNSSIVFDYLSISLLLIFSHFIRSKKNYKLLFNFLIVISLSMLIAGTPLVLSILDEPLHRTVMAKQGFLTIISLELKSFFGMLIPSNMDEAFYLPAYLLKLMILISCFLVKNKKINLFLISILLTFMLKYLLSSDLTQIIFNNFFVFLKGFNFSRIANILPLLFSILLVAILNANKNKVLANILIILTITTSISFQLYFPTHEFTKEFLRQNLEKKNFELVKVNHKNKNIKEIISIIIDEKSYKYENFTFNVKTNSSFDTYYKFDVYKKIKLLVGSKRVASIGVNPMIAVMNDINVIDGYHNIYSLSYKKKFRKIIENELNQNKTWKDYYDNWGNRVFMFYNNKNNLLINFKEAKNLGAEYIISSFVIKNKNLESNCLLCDANNQIYLYKII